MAITLPRPVDMFPLVISGISDDMYKEEEEEDEEISNPLPSSSARASPFKMRRNALRECLATVGKPPTGNSWAVPVLGSSGLPDLEKNASRYGPCLTWPASETRIKDATRSPPASVPLDFRRGGVGITFPVKPMFQTMGISEKAQPPHSCRTPPAPILALAPPPPPFRMFPTGP
ncbi:hypothetical protein SERLADRAFT_440904 [Serpula lacrymans var. lacrymans S7.9]|uniref:Uncharacterized protein n=1 Tax=Serpula lacrymans var. lacrymans (strain S7.9) TaxID=578457 RepID=F8P4W8_SERL9|nr:uncharacterized protein SERLADRAFT_440904 [Serpula lacrymans var. lacrymans S7.9]EGO21655.1 hypothetical protein SERLADRAFT_440904 [Serpula lacrymans var. lacrymans S7.9]